MQIKNTQFSSIEQITGKYLHGTDTKKSTQVEKPQSFQEVLSGKVAGKEQLRFTRHANERLDRRNISISQEQMQRLEDGAKRAGEKGIKESLVLVDSLAFIVDTRQNTVITAMNQEDAGENIYTNIDGAVII